MTDTSLELNDKPIVIAELLARQKELLHRDPSDYDYFNQYFFLSWNCSNKFLKSKAADLIDKISALVNEVLISQRDYVHFEHEKSVGTNTLFIMISNDVGAVGGFSFLTSKGVVRDIKYWEGEYKEAIESQNYVHITGKSWNDFKVEFTKKIKLRSKIRKVFMPVD